jgi:hypothetical protein
MLRRSSLELVELGPPVYLISELGRALPVPGEHQAMLNVRGQAARIEQSGEPPGRVRESATQAYRELHRS